MRVSVGLRTAAVSLIQWLYFIVKLTKNVQLKKGRFKEGKILRFLGKLSFQDTGEWPLDSLFEG